MLSCALNVMTHTSGVEAVWLATAEVLMTAVFVEKLHLMVSTMGHVCCT